jgi:enoyl-CoA hydratase/carnithine racemase
VTDPTTGLQITVDGPVATLTLDRPDARNAQTPRMWAAMREFGTTLPESVRVVVVRGAGPSFSAGLDRAAFTPDPADPDSLAALLASGETAAAARIASYQAAFGWLAGQRVVSVAALHGHAVGAGFQLALACDLRVVADDAVLTMAEVPLGLVPDLGGTKRLVELVGYAAALDICVTGRRVGAEEAHRLGLASRVSPRADLDETVAALVADVLRAPAEAVAEVKALLLAAADREQSAQEVAERTAQLRRLRALLSPG